MMKKTLVLMLVGLALFASGCATTMTRQERYPGMYAEQPKSILVLPPMNMTTAADAKAYYSTTIAEPLSFKGYYIFPVPVVSEIMQHEGLYDTELLYDAPVSMFKEKFGADCVLFTRITEWDLVYFVIGGSLTVAFDSELRSTETNEVLWKNHARVAVDLSGGSGNIFVAVVATAINALAADYVPHARKANYISYAPMPVGPHNPRHLQDGEDKLTILK